MEFGCHWASVGMNSNMRLEIPSADQGLEGNRLDTSIHFLFFVVPMSSIVLKDVTVQRKVIYESWSPVQERMRTI